MDLNFLERVSIAVAEERSVDEVLTAITYGLADEPDAALARIWLMGPGDICSACRMREQCPDQTRCLHLATSRGKSRVDPDETWSRIDGNFRRFPLGVRKVGQVGGSGEPILLGEDIQQAGWLADPDWARAEGIRCFAGHPLRFRGETLGVLALFSRKALNEEEFQRMGVFASNGAVAIANARAFEEIDALRKQRELENTYLRREIRNTQALGEIIGTSSGIQKLLVQVALVASTDASVLILGETGTGKELVARAIHDLSHRKDRAFIKVNCSAIPRDLFESEFFGHTKGAFTGAVRDRVGRFQLAHAGTIFLDEVGEIPIELQSKLLRVLQEGAFERIGEASTRNVDVRVIAATHRDLKGDPKAFRQDLYFRLSVFPIDVLPLRERAEDIPLLADHFVQHSARRLNLTPPKLTKEQIALLRNYDWPGNIRELQNVIERAVILARGGPLHLEQEQALTFAPAAPSPAMTPAEVADVETRVLTETEMRGRERSNLIAALERTGWKVHGPNGAAELLGIKPTTLAARMKKMGIRRPNVGND